jgi:hypothetical protein
MESIEVSCWITTILDAIIVYILCIEYYYDKHKDEIKKQKRTRTTKKTTTNPGGSSIVEEQVEVTEPINQKEEIK